MSTEAYGVLGIGLLIVLFYFVVTAIWSDVRFRRHRRKRLEAEAEALEQIQKFTAERHALKELLKKRGSVVDGLQPELQDSSHD